MISTNKLDIPNSHYNITLIKTTNPTFEGTLPNIVAYGVPLEGYIQVDEPLIAYPVLRTSLIKSIDFEGNKVYINTLNSTYLLEELHDTTWKPLQTT